MEPVRGSRIERKKEETKKRIIAVAMDLFFKQGFDETTVEQISEEADIAKGTIYNHFPVKEAIISEYILQEIKGRGPEVALFLLQLPDTRSRLITILHKSLEWVEVEFDKELYKKYFAYRMQTLGQAVRGESPRSGFQNALAQIIALGQETGEIRKDIPSEVLALQLESLHAVTVADWLYIPERFSVDRSISWNVDTIDYVTVRLRGEVKFYEGKGIKERIISNNDLVRSIYQSADNPIFEVFYIEHGEAKIFDFSGQPPRSFSF